MRPLAFIVIMSCLECFLLAPKVNEGTCAYPGYEGIKLVWACRANRD